jgi:predicted HTH transcriptional regulator
MIPMTPSPRNMIVVLLSRLNGDVIDEWFFNETQGNNIGVEISVAEQDLENLVTLGESETVEFKRKRPTPEELTLTICAFANTHGGRLLIGVTDSAEVIGCDDARIDDWITNCLRSHCDPTPRFRVISTEVRSKRVIVIEIPEGVDKPYTLREKGIYVRSGATSRSALRHEIERLVGQQQSRGGLWS